MPSYAIKGTRRVLKPNATVVGGLRIENNVASGFSASSYLKTPETFPAPTNKFEAKAKVVTPSAFDACNIIYYCGGSWALQHDTASNSVISFWIYKAGTGFERVISVPSTTLLATNTLYWFKVTWDGSVYNLLYSTDDKSYTSVGTYASTTPLLSSGTVAVGLNDGASKYPYLGSIDLSQSHIKINDELWWTGTKLVPENKYYLFRRKKNRYYKDTVVTKYWKKVNWTQPTSPSGITATSGWASPASAFDKNASTYASCGTSTDYIEWNIGSNILLRGITATGQWVSSGARSCNLIVKSVDVGGVETTLGKTTGAGKTSTYNLSVTFAEVQVNRLRFYLTNGDDNAAPTTTYKSRIRDISLVASHIVAGTADDYTYTTTETTTIEVSANDDYNRIETGGESTYVLKRLEETKIYMKYVYQNWVQPVLTSDTSSSKMSLSATSTYNTTYAMWKAFDNNSSTAWLSADGTGSGSLRVKFPTNLFISKIAVTGWSNPNGATKTVTIYKDTTNTNVIGAAHTFNGSGTYTWTFSNPVETNALSFHAVGTGKWGCIGEIKITAQERITTVGTPDDYDYIVTV